jgi:ribonuclease P protein component
MVDGTRLRAYPLHLVYMPVSERSSDKVPFQIAVSAPKRIHRKAVNRNVLKRQMRAIIRPLIPELEAFIEESGTAYACMLIYVGSEKQASSSLEPRLNLLLQRFKEESNTPSTDEQTQDSTSQA